MYPEPSIGNMHDTQYKHWVTSIGLHLAQEYTDVPLFTTNQGPALWDAYINQFPVEEHDYHRCSCCMQYVETYGSLVTIGSKGHLIPVMWDTTRAPSRYRASVEIMVDMLRGNGTWKDYQQVEVTGVFVSSRKVWGTPASDKWRHYYVVPPSTHVYDGWGNITAKQRATLYKENYQLLQRALDKYYREPEYDLVPLALSMVSNQYGGESVLKKPLEWFNNLISRTSNTASQYQQDNIVWLEAATSPLSYCHISSNTVGNYLNNLLLWPYT